MQKNGKVWEENDVSHVMNKLPAEIVIRFLQKLSVIDRLKSERVSPQWNQMLSKQGWIEQRKLDAGIVFEGANRQNIDQFWAKLDGGDCRLATLLDRCGLSLRVLDLYSFGEGNIEKFLQKIVESIESNKKLEKLNIKGLRLRDFVDHLHSTLREFKIFGQITVETLETLSLRCPNLEKVPVRNLFNKYDLETEILVNLIGRFPRVKKVDLSQFILPSEKPGTLVSFGQLRELEELNLWHCLCLDGESFKAIVDGCQRLRSFSFGADRLTEAALFQLANISNLTGLVVCSREGELEFSDAVLKDIAHRGQLEKLMINGAKALTDNAMVYLVNRCKSLISLALYRCPQITERSVEAVVFEIRKRHGWPPKSLPNGNQDPEKFYFRFIETGINDERAVELISENPWVVLSH